MTQAMEPGGVHKPPDDREEVYFEGTPSLKGEIGTLTICALIDIALLVIAVITAKVIGTTAGWLISIPSALLLGSAVLLYPVILLRLKRYKITNYRIDYERGLLSKSIDTLELWHVEDLSFQQSIWARMWGVGTIVILSHDDTIPRLEMRGLPKPRELFDVLKQRVISVKRQRGVLKVDTGT